MNYMEENLSFKHLKTGLDISTSIIGVSILDGTTNNVIYLDQIDLTGISSNIYDKTVFFEKTITNILNELSIKYPNEVLYITDLYIEESAKKFQNGKTKAEILAKLHKMNALASYTFLKIAQTFNSNECLNKRYPLLQPTLEIKEINVSTARSKIGFKKDKTSNDNVKDQVFSWVLTKYPNLNLPMKTITRNTVNYVKGQVVYDDGAKDCVDAFVICLGGILIDKLPAKPVVKKKKKK